MMSPSNSSCVADIASPSAVERRESIRHSCSREVFCRQLDDAMQPSSLVTIRDISTDGISLFTRDYFAPDTLLAIEVDSALPDSWWMKTGRAIHVREAQAGHHWIVGCRFTSRLSIAEMQAFLR